MILCLCVKYIFTVDSVGDTPFFLNVIRCWEPFLPAEDSRIWTQSYCFDSWPLGYHILFYCIKSLQPSSKPANLWTTDALEINCLVYMFPHPVTCPSCRTVRKVKLIMCSSVVAYPTLLDIYWQSNSFLSLDHRLIILADGCRLFLEIDLFLVLLPLCRPFYITFKVLFILLYTWCDIWLRKA